MRKKRAPISIKWPQKKRDPTLWYSQLTRGATKYCTDDDKEEGDN